jgi:hypothetical protein
VTVTVNNYSRTKGVRRQYTDGDVISFGSGDVEFLLFLPAGLLTWNDDDH